MSYLIAIDGLDGSGKGTQSELLAAALTRAGYPVTLLSFPRYDSESSALVRLYLGGGIGSSPDDTNAYAASAFYACDRYISYKTEWGAKLASGEVVICNRYTSANAVHQLAKLPGEDWDAFLTWLYELEFSRFGIPTPDLTIYLEQTPEISAKLVEKRSSATGQVKDIHELDRDFMRRSYDAAMYASDKLGWERIRCYEGEEPLSIEAVEGLIARVVEEKLGLKLRS